MAKAESSIIDHTYTNDSNKYSINTNSHKRPHENSSISTNNRSSPFKKNSVLVNRVYPPENKSPFEVVIQDKLQSKLKLFTVRKGLKCHHQNIDYITRWGKNLSVFVEIIWLPMS